MLTVSKVDDQNLYRAFSILEAVGNWLRETGRRQRIDGTSIKTYQKWQQQHANYWVGYDRNLAGIFSLPDEQLDDWPEFSNGQPVRWLRALATHPDFRGLGIGRFSIDQALRFSSGPVYLDCVTGFLPTYYSDSGFRTIGRKRINGYDVTLMRHDNELAAP